MLPWDLPKGAWDFAFDNFGKLKNIYIKKEKKKVLINNKMCNNNETNH